MKESYSICFVACLFPIELSNICFLSLDCSSTDTQIEPVVGIPTTEPILYTGGLEYVGYGDLYLEILRVGTKEGRSQMFDYEL